MAMKLLGAAVAGSIAGLVGAGIWAAITYFTGAEVGWIAWGVGGAVGFAIRAVIGRSGDAVAGVLAMAIAVLAVLGGKYAAVTWAVKHEVGKLMAQVKIEDDDLIRELAREVAKERESAGEDLEWPDEMSIDDAATESDFPSGVWADAHDRWEALVPKEREARRRKKTEEFALLAGTVSKLVQKEAFSDSFGKHDVLWFPLAAGTAFWAASVAASSGSRRTRRQRRGRPVTG
jgi:hypothetical protein